MTEEAKIHFKELQALRIPAKRAAYSDRTAWTMAVLSELAYVPFDGEDKAQLTALAVDLAKLATGGNDQQGLAATVEDRIRSFLQRVRDPAANGGDEQLKAALAAGGFELAAGKPIHEPATDTQAYVAIRKPEGNDPGMAVIVFRGTTNVRDWMKNVDIRSVPVESTKSGASVTVGNFHRGFHGCYQSVHEEIERRLAGTEDLPLYIAGHSLGGALAVIATWYQSGQRLAACYTFGAPRVGDHLLMGSFRTPIYRIVNAADPVPFLPPSGLTLNAIKALLRLLDSVLPFAGIFNWLLNRTIKVQSFRHYGDIRYLPFADPGADGSYRGLRLYTGVSALERLLRYFRVIVVPARSDKGSARDRVDRYHEMRRYRDKLRLIARDRNS